MRYHFAYHVLLAEHFFGFPNIVIAGSFETSVKSCKEACRRVLTSTLLYSIRSESSCDIESETYKLNLKNYIYNYNNYVLNLVGRSIGKFFHHHLVSGSSCRFKISSFDYTLRRLL
jgi:hypothetical protein